MLLWVLVCYLQKWCRAFYVSVNKHMYIVSQAICTIHPGVWKIKEGSGQRPIASSIMLSSTHGMVHTNIRFKPVKLSHDTKGMLSLESLIRALEVVPAGLEYAELKDNSEGGYMSFSEWKGCLSFFLYWRVQKSFAWVQVWKLWGGWVGNICKDLDIVHVYYLRLENGWG